MKKLFLLCGLVLLSFLNQLQAQTQLDSAEIAQVKALLNETAEEKAKQNTGVFELKGCNGVALKNKVNGEDVNTNTLVTIDSVQIYFYDGLIQDVLFFGKQIIKGDSVDNNDTIYKQYRAYKAIPLLHFHGRMKDRAFDLENKDTFIYVGDVIRYTANAGANYIPDNGAFKIKCGDAKLSLKKNIGLNFLVDVRVYSDILGTFFNEPNGLVNTEASTRIITNTEDIWGRSVILFNSIKPSLSLTRFDNNQRFTNIDTSTLIIDRQDALQKSWLNFGLTVNLFRHWYTGASQYDTWGLNAGYNGYLTKVVRREGDTANGYINSWFAELFYEPRVSSNFGVDMGLSLNYLNFSNANFISNSESRFVLRPRAELFYHSVNKQSKLFLRYYSFLDLKEREKGFFQLQFGYSANLNEVLKK